MPTTHDNGEVIALRDVTKRFRAFTSNKRRVLSWLSAGRLGGGRWVTALDDVSLTVRRGDALAVVGANGAGKSTLLKIVTGTLTATSGHVSRVGRVGALLELGMGFHPQFTGRENIRLNGLLLGMTHAELRGCIDRIIDFSELGEFINEPLHTYSTGMVLRLGYSVAAAIQPAILVIDEALAVGDAAFQQKCFDHLRRFLEDGGTLLFVSHEPQAVLRICQRALLLEHGAKVAEGSPSAVLQEYSARLASGAGRLGGTASVRFATKSSGIRGGQFRAMIESVTMTTGAGEHPGAFVTGRDVDITVRGLVLYPVRSLTVGICIHDRTGADVFGTNSAELGQPIPVAPGGAFEARFRLPLNLGPGAYTLSAALHEGDQHLAGNYDWADQIASFNVVSDPAHKFTGAVWLPTTLDIVPEQRANTDRAAHVWSEVFADAPAQLAPGDAGARYILTGLVPPAAPLAAARLRRETLIALRLCADRLTVRLAEPLAPGHSVSARILDELLAPVPATSADELCYTVPPHWRNRVAVICLDCGDPGILFEQISAVEPPPEPHRV